MTNNQLLYLAVALFGILFEGFSASQSIRYSQLVQKGEDNEVIPLLGCLIVPLMMFWRYVTAALAIQSITLKVGPIWVSVLLLVLYAIWWFPVIPSLFTKDDRLQNTIEKANDALTELIPFASVAYLLYFAFFV